MEDGRFHPLPPVLRVGDVDLVPLPTSVLDSFLILGSGTLILLPIPHYAVGVTMLPVPLVVACPVTPGPGGPLSHMPLPLNNSSSQVGFLLFLNTQKY